ncbi:MAG: winged helix-turn-helix transcriptional regulator [Alphaproteobacteria bacterium]|nr:winged helix-turn-helix transcriptional regulator [Alphaproteobacteria bacterium]
MTMTNSDLHLDDFLPYRLSVLTNTVSGAIAKIYAERFGVTVAEWRVMAVLGMTSDLAANEICRRTAMDKVRVSRAVGRMLSRQLIERRIDDRDRRRSKLRLSKKGRRIYAEIVPFARYIETQLLTVLTESETSQLDGILNKLQRRAGELGRVT